MTETWTDVELLQKIAAGDRQALAELYDRYERMVYGLAWRLMQDAQLAEEIVQDVFTRVWQKGQSYDPDQGKFSTWLLQVTRNRALDVLKSRKRRQQETLQDDAQWRDVRDEAPTTEDAVLVNLQRQEIRDALETLHEDQQAVIRWMYFQGLTQQEVSERYKIPLGTVKSRVRLALNRLKQTMEMQRERGDRHAQPSV